jgi:hypothetical protein
MITSGNIDNINKKPKSRLIIICVIAIVIALFIVLTIVFYPSLMSKLGLKNSQPVWYAVDLSNGQIYVGQIQSITPETIVLAKTFYMESYGAGTNPEGQAAQFFGLVRRGITAPLVTDQVMFINRSTVIFWEKLDSNSDTVQRLNQQN